MIPNSDITGLVLAGGEGRRFGGRDKGLEDWHGRPLVAQVVDRLQPRVARLIISCNRHSDRYRAYATDVFPDTRDGYQGPLAGIEAAVAHIDTPFVVIAPCDVPMLPWDVVDHLCAPMAAVDGPEITYAHDGQRAHYLVAAMRTACLDSLPAFLDGGGRAVRHWYAEHRAQAVVFADPAAFANVNSLL